MKNIDSELHNALIQGFYSELAEHIGNTEFNDMLPFDIIDLTENLRVELNSFNNEKQ